MKTYFAPHIPQLIKENQQLAKEIERLNKKVTALENSNRLCVEFGYVQCEKGNNLDAAIINYNKLLSNVATIEEHLP